MHYILYSNFTVEYTLTEANEVGNHIAWIQQNE